MDFDLGGEFLPFIEETPALVNIFSGLFQITIDTNFHF